MPKYTDEQGNEVELPTPEELAAVRQQAEEATALKTQLAEQEAKLKAFENKDFNFKRLRDMKDEEKAKLTADQLASKQEAEELRQRIENTEKAQTEDAKETFFTEQVGSDEDLKRRVEYEFSLLNMPAGTAKEIKAKYGKALQNATAGQALNPLNAYAPSMGVEYQRQGGTAKDLKPDVADLAKRMGLNFTKKSA